MPDFNTLLTDEELAAVADEAAETSTDPVTEPAEPPVEPAPLAESVVEPTATVPPVEPPPSVDQGLVQQATSVLGQIEARLLTLEAKYEAGELSFQQFRAEERTLLRHQREAEGVVMQARIEAQVAQQTAQREWTTAVMEFRQDPTNAALENPVVLPMMQAVLEDLRAKQPGLSAKDQLGQAKAQVQHQLRSLLGLPSDTPVSPAKGGTPRTPFKAPPVLSSVPTADNNAISEFSGLDRLTGVEYETALGRLTPDQQQRYLMAA